MTATQAKYLRKETWDTDTENTSINPQFHGDFNAKAREPKPAVDSWMTKYWGKETLALQMKDKNKGEETDSSSDSDSDSDSSDDSSGSESEGEQQNVQWEVTADLGELDDHSTLIREADNGYLNGKAKFHGWTNPLGWRDSGDDDDLVLFQLTADGFVERRITDSMMLQYDESEGPTKVDFGDTDQHVIGREADNDYLKAGAKFHGWTNPLSWTDDGNDDAKIL